MVMVSMNAEAQIAGANIGTPSLVKVSFAELPNWNHSKARLAMKSLHNSCSIAKNAPPKAYGMTMTLGAWNALCHDILRKDIKKAKTTFEQYFDPFKVQIAGDETGKGLLTGYYTPMLNGSLVRDENHQVPIYGLPNLREDKNAFTRTQINAGALNDKAEVIIWINDEIEAFFLHIQGSGYVNLPDGSTKKLVFAGKNEKPYTAIGKQFVEQGIVKPEDLSMQWLKNWLRTNPDQAQNVMQSNDSYIFFSLENVNNNVRGAESTPLTPMASVAIDPQYISYGLPIYVNSGQFSTLAIAQDTGSAIKGAMRADLYSGVGKKAGAFAGKLKAKADFYLLYPRQSSLGVGY